ncbi:MAG: ABC transporter substrate-binding protein [Rhodospirillales bacterium]|jgi:branched-chain amino acid transport system substrate-binding protein|nr:ABC transporter substrate-binding protein [Rhodospirillales bacterium]
MLDRRHFLIAAGAMAALAPLARRAHAAPPIRVGEINSYSGGVTAFTFPYRHGWQLALDEINAAGGVLGRPIEVISRDDGGKPADAITAANELVTGERVTLLMGTFLSNVGLAVSDFARQKGVLFLAAEPLSDALIWEKGNRYTFRLRPSTSMQANMLADAAAKLAPQRWASIAPNYEYGRSAVAAFKAAMAARRGDLAWVEEQWPPLFKLDGGPTVQALLNAGPQAIFNATFAQDLSVFVREGEARGLFKDREVISLLTGEPEYLEPLGAEAPRGWLVTGYPWYAIDTPEHNAFLAAYRARVGDHPRLGSVVGYAAMKSVAAILARAGGTETERLIAAARGVGVDTPFGPIVYRPEDHQSTMGAFVGRTDVKDGKGIMVDWVYADGARFLPPAEEVRKLRPAE